MKYEITAPQPESHFIEIKYTISSIDSETIEVQLPAWRPGRYELQNFAKNVRTFAAYDHKGSLISSEKITKDRWRIATEGISEVTVNYSYYANTQNAGTSYVDADYWYLNFINFSLYTEGRIDEPCTVKLNFDPTYKVACGLNVVETGVFKANDFYELVDCPLLASKSLRSIGYEINDIPFKVWFQGGLEVDIDKVRNDFYAFTKEQIQTMKEFPEKEYHFMNLILPTPFYHGVEHRNSTMIVLGPGDDGEGLYTDLLGVSSHELFHAWNIIRIRPKELLPYDFTKENYFNTCFIAEGVTTYYGDLFLKRSQVFDEVAYLKELHIYLKRHFEGASEASLSLLESSYDLWLDGYDKGIPQRKVSVYQKGALVALILDLYIRKKFKHKRSIDDVMRVMWERYGRPFIGYSYQDYQEVVEEILEEQIPWYWRDCIGGTVSIEKYLNEAFEWVGLRMSFDGAAAFLQVLEPRSKERDQWLSSPFKG